MKHQPEEPPASGISPPEVVEDAPPPVPSLREFDLSSEGGRLAFLWTLWESHQEAGLLMATQHVWASLPAAGPVRAARARQMAAQLGIGCTGRAAVFELLRRFLHEANHDIAMGELPARAAYGDFDAWNADALAVFDHFHTQWEQLARRYEAILDGRQPDTRPPAPPRRSAVVIPWPR